MFCAWPQPHLLHPRQETMARQSYTPCFFECHFRSTDGECIVFNATALLYESGRTFWELRRLLMALMPHVKHFKVNSEVLRQAGGWKAIVEQLGLSWGDHFRPSARAHRAGDEGGIVGQGNEAIKVDEYTRDEVTISTLGMFACLFQWSCFRRYAKDRALATDLMEQLLARTLPCDAVAAYCFQSLLSEPHVLCESADERGCCEHVSKLDLECSSWPIAEAHHKLCELMRGWVLLVPQCALAQALLRSLVVCRRRSPHRPRLGRHRRCCEAANAAARQERLRIDEDYKQAKMIDAKLSGRSASGAQALAVDRDMPHESVGRYWAERHLARHVTKLWSLSNGKKLSGVHCIVEDGSRLGSPAEETQLYAYYNFGAGAGGWLLVQVVY